MLIDKLQLKRSNKTVTDASTGTVSPKLPNPSDLENGELALNYADGYETIAFKNDNGEIVEIKSNNQIEQKLDSKADKVEINKYLDGRPMPFGNFYIYNFPVEKWVLYFDNSVNGSYLYIKTFSESNNPITPDYLYYVFENGGDGYTFSERYKNVDAPSFIKGLLDSECAYNTAEKNKVDTLWSERSEGNTFSDLATALSAITRYGSVCIGNKQFNLKSDNTFTWGNAYVASLAEGTYSETYGDAGNYANFSYLLNESQSKFLTLGFFLSDNTFIPYNAATNVVNVINQNNVKISFDMVLYQTTLKIRATDTSQQIIVTSVRPSSKGIIYQGSIDGIPTAGLIIDYGIGGENTFGGALIKIEPTNETQKLNCDINLSFKACDYRQLEIS